MNTLHDLEEDYDPFYSQYGVPGSDRDMNAYDKEETEQFAEMLGVVIVG